MSSPTSTAEPGVMYSLPELTALLIRDQGLHEGHFELSIELNIAVGAVGPNEQAAMPGAVIGVKRVGLRKVESPNVLSIDAAEANPTFAAIPAKRKRAIKS